MADVLERRKRSASSKTTKPKPREDSRRANAAPARSKAKTSETPPASPKRRRGRPAVHGDAVVVSVRLPGELVDQIDEIVAKSGHVYRDRSEFVRQTVAQAMADSTRVRQEREKEKAQYLEDWQFIKDHWHLVPAGTKLADCFPVPTSGTFITANSSAAHIREFVASFVGAEAKKQRA